jgi:hypothetical protein
MSDVRVGANLDLTLNELRNARVQGVAGLPTATSANAGQIVYNLPDKRLYQSDGSSWNLKATDSDALSGHNSAYHLSRSNHTGTQLSSTISDLAATIAATALSALAAPTGPLSLGGQKATNAADGTSATDLATWGQVQELVSDQGFKLVRVASTANVPVSSTGNGATIDGVAVATGDLVLLKNQTAGAENGIYVVGAGSLTRDPNSDIPAELPPGTIVVVAEGTTNDNTMWMLTTNRGYTMGTTTLTFTSYGSTPNPYSAGNGISIAGNVISAVIAAAAGLTLTGSGLGVDATVFRKGWWEGNVPVPGSGTASTINHALGRRWVQATVYEVSSGDQVLTAVNAVDANNVRLDFSAAPTSGQYYAVVS